MKPSKRETRASVVILAMLFVVVAFWMAGFDFNERGVDAVGCYIITIGLGGAAYFLHYIATDFDKPEGA